MTTVTSNTTTTPADIYASLNAKDTATTPASTANAQTDKFLKMLVAQMQNQDPLNPMDNAQVTSQMAQINTVSGIDQVNTSVKSLNGQLLQMQALQGAGLVGRQVALAGNQMSIESGTGSGAFEIAGTASAVEVQVLSADGKLVDTLQLGPQAAGRHTFTLPSGNATDSQGYTFAVKATNGATDVPATELQFDRVTSVSTSGDTLSLALQRNGSVPMSSILSFN